MQALRYEAIGLDYFDSAPVRFDARIVVAASTRALWRVFEDNEAWVDFEFGIDEATWTTPPPLRPGSRRHVTLNRWIGGGVVDEVFFEWKPFECFAFYMEDGTSDRIEAYGELWTLRDLGDERTEVRCRTACSLKGKGLNAIARFLSPVVELGYKSTLGSFRRVVEGRHAE